MQEKLQNLKLIAFDFDGIFTDSKVTVNQDGIESITCSKRDSMGLNELRRVGMKMCVISKEQNKVVAIRCQKLNLECLIGIDNKLVEFKKIIQREGLTPDQVAFMGDDINDLECMEYAGLSFTVSGGDKKCKAIADHTTIPDGGNGAIREVCDLITEAKDSLKL